MSVAPPQHPYVITLLGALEEIGKLTVAEASETVADLTLRLVDIREVVQRHVETSEMGPKHQCSFTISEHGHTYRCTLERDHG